MSKIFTDYNIGDDLTANDANKSFVDINNIVVRVGNNIGTALSDSDNYALNDGINAFATSRSNAFDVSGTNNAIILTTSNTFNHAPIRSYFAGLKVGFFTSATNTGATTINIDSLGVKNVKTIAGIDFIGGELNSYVELIYNGNNFVLLNQKTQSQYIPDKILLSNNSTNPNTQIDFSAGNFEFSDKSGFANFTAQTGDLSLNFGTGLGMLDIGTKAPSTWYYCYAIYNPTTNVSKVLCSTASPSLTGAYTGSNMPSGYTEDRYIGALKTYSSGNIAGGTWLEDGTFLYTSEILEFYNQNDSNTGIYSSLAGVPNIPVLAYVKGSCYNDAVGAYPFLYAGTNATNSTLAVNSSNTGVSTGFGFIYTNNTQFWRAWGGQDARRVYLYTNAYKDLLI
jgi:hypothetical protein